MVLKNVQVYTALTAPVPGAFVTLPEISEVAFSLAVGGPDEVYQLSYFFSGADIYSSGQGVCRGALQILSGQAGPDFMTFLLPAVNPRGEPVNPATGTNIFAGWPSGTYYGHLVYPADCLSGFYLGKAQLMISRVQ